MKKLILQCSIIIIISLTIVTIFTTCSYKAAKNGMYLTIYEKPYNTFNYDLSSRVLVGNVELTIQYGLFGVDHVYGNYSVPSRYDGCSGIINDPFSNKDSVMYEKIDSLQINNVTIFIWWMLLSTLIYVIYKVKIIIKSKYIEENQNEN